ncbi:hypothetical protein RFI_27402 [Reticulomyxa filosa]|uniref:Uncharacterized protein n=1 Tax=Reticulomyxa filosa TaxID=46433 RepID=X6MAC4_RETFI|nr:hypothetical protein RFI_27402 [Reticulomyxa filosa]|eukprot:ETO09975.1 hypothetical protein RFI_27402 [Reticulomyxa filosa]
MDIFFAIYCFIKKFVFSRYLHLASIIYIYIVDMKRELKDLIIDNLQDSKCVEDIHTIGFFQIIHYSYFFTNYINIIKDQIKNKDYQILSDFERNNLLYIEDLSFNCLKSPKLLDIRFEFLITKLTILKKHKIFIPYFRFDVFHIVERLINRMLIFKKIISERFNSVKKKWILYQVLAIIKCNFDSNYVGCKICHREKYDIYLFCNSILTYYVCNRLLCKQFRVAFVLSKDIRFNKETNIATLKDFRLTKKKNNYD